MASIENLEHLPTVIVKTKVKMQMLGYSNDSNDTCAHGVNVQTTERLLACPGIGELCTNKDLGEATNGATICPLFWTPFEHGDRT